MSTNDDIIHMPIPRSMYVAVCALLGGVSAAAVATAFPSPKPTAAPVAVPTAAPVAVPAADTVPNAAPVAAVASTGDIAGAASDDGTLDAAGWAWDASLHASTKGTTKDGLWRMKVGVSRPDPKPGFPKAEAGGTGTTKNGAASQAPASAAIAPVTSTDDDDDEFASFRAAADKANETDAAAVAAVPARKWTDADLGALCNQAAVKLGDPLPVKTLIEHYTAEGAVPHSRNIADDQREAFVKAVEAKAGITFAG